MAKDDNKINEQNNDQSKLTREIRPDSRNISANMGRRQGPATLSFDFDFDRKPGSEDPKDAAKKTITEPPAEPAAMTDSDGRRTIIKDNANESLEKTKTQYGLPADYRDELYDELKSAASEVPEAAPAKSDFGKSFDAFKSKVKNKIAEKQEEAKLARAAAEEKKRQEEIERAAAAAALEEKKAQEEYEAQLEEAIRAEKKAQRAAARANIKNKKPVRPQKSVSKISGTAKGAGRIVKPKEDAAKEEKKSAGKAAAKPVNKPVKKSYSTFKIGGISRIAAGGKSSKAKSDKAKAEKAKAAKAAGGNKPAKPKKEKKPRKPRKTWVRVILGFIKIAIAVAIVGGVAGGGYVAYTISHADPIHPELIYNTIDVSTHIYNDKGKLTDDIFYSENRDLATYEQLPENLKNSFIAIEDKTFWTHNGFNVRRIFGAIWSSIRGGGEISGTSTITQQLARNVFLPEEKSIRSLKRKIIEMYYAYEIEQELSKEEILTAYLNTIYLGYGCYGVDTAADKYFDEDVEDLTLEQCAALAALPPAPGVYALLVTENDEAETTTKIKKGLYANDISQQRRYLVLDLMAEQGYISADEAEAAKKPLTDFIKPGGATSSTTSSFKDYLLDTVKKDLMTTYNLSAEQAEKMIYTKGLNIYSTLNTQAQKAIMEQFRDDDNFPDAIDGESEVEAAMVITEVGTGKIKAMAGTRHVNGEKLFNRAVNPRQPGSSIKPLAVYAPALQKSYEYQKDGKTFEFKDTGYDSQGKKYWGDYITTSSGVVDERMKVKGKVWPQNFSRTYSGYKTFRQAMQLSLNTCAIKILSQVGVDYSMDMVKKFGISTVIDDTSESYNDVNLAALGLGAMTEGVTPLDMALAYAAFPNGGVVNSGICYTKVTDSNGKILLEGKSEETRVLNEGVAYIMTDMLQTVVTNGIAGEAAIDGEQVGGKTGTTDDTWDIWFDGFTANYSAALWIGTDENVPLNTTSTTAARLWSRIMSNVKKARGGEYRSRPDNVIAKNGEYYTVGTQPPDPPPETKKTEKKDDKKDSSKQTDKKDTKKESSKKD